jgi:hypothetical protein
MGAETVNLRDSHGRIPFLFILHESSPGYDMRSGRYICKTQAP